MQGAQASDKGPRSDIDISNQIEWKAIECDDDCKENKIAREFEEV